MAVMGQKGTGSWLWILRRVFLISFSSPAPTAGRPGAVAGYPEATGTGCWPEEQNRTDRSLEPGMGCGGKLLGERPIVYPLGQGGLPVSLSNHLHIHLDDA